MELAVHLVERPERIGPQIEEARRAGAEALNVLASPILYARRFDIFERTSQSGRIGAMPSAVMSAPVSTATTPAMAPAAVVSMRRMRAWLCGEQGVPSP